MARTRYLDGTRPPWSVPAVRFDLITLMHLSNEPQRGMGVSQAEPPPSRPSPNLPDRVHDSSAHCSNRAPDFVIPRD